MKVARSTFYYRRKDPAAREAADQILKAQIEAVHADFPGYGQRRLDKHFRRQGVIVNKKRLARIVQKYGLQAIRWRAFTPKTTNSNHPWPRYPHLLTGLSILRPNQVWVGDITYIRLRWHFVYLATILDYYARLAVGWALSRGLDHTLTVAALDRALTTRQPEPGCIHHSDQGVQYACAAYTDLLKAHGFQISMAAKGNPYDNAVMEAFYKTLKYEEVHLNDYATMDDAWNRLPFFIEEVYNKKRLHSAIGYVPPMEFECQWHAKQGRSNGEVAEIIHPQEVVSTGILARNLKTFDGKTAAHDQRAPHDEKIVRLIQTVETPVLYVG